MSAKQSESSSDAIENDAEVKTVDLMSSADSVMSHWQVSQAFMRMARRTKSKEIRAAFIQAEQQIILNLFSSITQNQLSEQKRRSDYADCPELKECPSELSKLVQSFPRILLSLFMFKKNWETRLLCDRCKQYVKLSELRVFDLCSRHHESVALHCTPPIQEIQGKPDPTSVIETYRKYSLMRSEDERGGDSRSEFLFARSIYNEPIHNMPTIQELFQCKDLSDQAQTDSDAPRAIQAST